MPLQSIIQALALIGAIAIIVWLAIKPERTEEPDSPAAYDYPAELADCETMARGTLLWAPPTTERLRDLGEAGTDQEVARRIKVNEVREESFESDVQRRECSAQLIVAQDTGRSNVYTARFEIVRGDEEVGNPVAHLLAVERLTLPVCDSPAVIDLLGQNIALSVAGGRASQAARDAIAGGLSFSEIAETSFDEARQRRRCRGAVTLELQGETVYAGRIATWLIHWGTEPGGIPLIELQF